MILIKNKRIANILLRNLYSNNIKISGLSIIGIPAEIIGKPIDRVRVLLGCKSKHTPYTVKRFRAEGWFISNKYRNMDSFIATNGYTISSRSSYWGLMMLKLPPRKIYELNSKDNGKTK